MATSDFGEFALIARLTAHFPHADTVVQGVGDDAAVLNWASGSQLVATCDAQVEGRHFLRTQSSADQIGRRALAVNLSDLAAMGAEPLFALVSLVLPAATPTGWLEDLYGGLRTEASQFGVAIVGGNIAASAGPLVVDITLLGRVARGKAVLRSGARPGDRLCVTGTLGSAAAGLLTLREPLPEPRDANTLAIERSREEAQAAQQVPRPRVAEGRALAGASIVTAMIDVSDGLAADLGHICERSQVSAVVEETALPIAPATAEVAAAYRRDPVELALFGGDDYELLFTVPDEATERALAIAQAAGGSAHAIGWIVAAANGEPATTMQLRLPDGSERPLPARGWDHLRPSPT